MNLNLIKLNLEEKGFSKKEIEDKLILLSLIGKESIVALGVDQGYANAGYSIISYNILTDEFVIKVFGTITTSSKDELNKRIKKIYYDIKDILSSDSNISLMGCEKLFHNKPMGSPTAQNPFATRNKSASIMKANMVTGILFLLSAEQGLFIKEFAPTSVKKHITGNGKATKAELEIALKEITEKQGIKIKTDHESDSIGIGITVIKDYCEKIVEAYKKQIKEGLKEKELKNKSKKTRKNREEK